MGGYILRGDYGGVPGRELYRMEESEIMGMFDTILVPRGIVTRLSDKEAELIDAKYPDAVIHFQTKDFACSLDTAVMADDGSLIWETNNGWYGSQPEITNYTGVLNFYEYINEEQPTLLKPHVKGHWIEYEAEYLDGKMLYIKRV
jgi:hypothetical protein